MSFTQIFHVDMSRSAINQKYRLAIDVAAAQRQICIFAGASDPIIDVRIIPESTDLRNELRKKFRGNRVTRRLKFRGRLSDLERFLKSKNEAGYAIFILPNETDGQGVKKENIKKVRVLSLDLDGAPLPKQWEIEPHLIVETSPGRYQCFWALDPTTDFAACEGISRRLAAHYRGDRSATDITHVFRLAGFFHQKGALFQSRIVSSVDPKHVAMDTEFERLTPNSFSFLPPLSECKITEVNATERCTILDANNARKLFALLSASDFRSDEENGDKRWREFAMSVHHASGGDPAVRDLFLAFCRTDPQYDDDAIEAVNRIRWDSFRGNKASSVTAGTLHKICRDHSVPSEVIHAIFNDPARDFEDDSEVEDSIVEPEFDASDFEGSDDGTGHPNLEAQSRLAELNDIYCAVFGQGRYRIMYREQYAGGRRWTAVSKADFLARYENQRVENGYRGPRQPETVPLGRAWQSWADRKTADGTTFDTAADPAAIVNGALNLWSGFGLEPTQGCWTKFRAMILNDLCNGNQRVFEYMLNWIAWKLQRPGQLPEVAIALIGPKGTGKTTLGKVLKLIFGEHGMIARDIQQIAGRFNGHLETKCFVYADEAVWGGDKPNESALKALITDSETSYEYKGLQIFTGLNHVGLIFAGNERWIVPASMDERRFCVTQVSGSHMVPDDAPKDHPHRLYWDAIHDELENGGQEAFLHDMLTKNLDHWHPRIGVPRTEALAEQKLLGLSGVAKWYHERLQAGTLFDYDDKEEDWAEGPLHANPTATLETYREWLHRKNPHAVVTIRSLLRDLKEFGWDGGDVGSPGTELEFAL